MHVAAVRSVNTAQPLPPVYAYTLYSIIHQLYHQFHIFHYSDSKVLLVFYPRMAALTAAGTQPYPVDGMQVAFGGDGAPGSPGQK